MTPKPSKEKKYVPLGMEWVRIDANREGLFVFITEIEPGKEPNTISTALTIPNISGQGVPGQPMYATREVSPGTQQAPTMPQQTVTPPAFERTPGLSIVNPKETGDDMVSTLDNIPPRQPKKS